MQKAANTSSGADDLAILKNVLSGNDSFELYYDGSIRPMGMGGMILFQLPPQMESISLMVGQVMILFLIILI